MSTLANVLTVMLGLSFVGSGVARLAGPRVLRSEAAHFGLGYHIYRRIGALEALGGVGLLVGLDVPALAVAAAAGLFALTVGAVIFHLRAKDPVAKPIGAGTVGLLVAATGILTIAG